MNFAWLKKVMSSAKKRSLSPGGYAPATPIGRRRIAYSGVIGHATHLDVDLISAIRAGDIDQIRQITTTRTFKPNRAFVRAAFQSRKLEVIVLVFETFKHDGQIDGELECFSRETFDNQRGSLGIAEFAEQVFSRLICPHNFVGATAEHRKENSQDFAVGLTNCLIDRKLDFASRVLFKLIAREKNSGYSISKFVENRDCEITHWCLANAEDVALEEHTASLIRQTHKKCFYYETLDILLGK
jgi:hypothetical protein